MKMKVTKVYGNNNEIIGYITTDFFGNKEVLDANLKVRGHYKKVENLTLDVYENIVGVGDGAYHLLKFI